jgi:hypothetical protein
MKNEKPHLVKFSHFLFFKYILGKFHVGTWMGWWDIMSRACGVRTRARPPPTPQRRQYARAPASGNFYWILNCATRTRRFWGGVQRSSTLSKQLQKYKMPAAWPRSWVVQQRARDKSWYSLCVRAGWVTETELSIHTAIEPSFLFAIFWAQETTTSISKTFRQICNSFPHLSQILCPFRIL